MEVQEPRPQPTTESLRREFRRLRGAVSEYPALRFLVERMPEETPNPERAGEPTETNSGPVDTMGYARKAVPDVRTEPVLTFADYSDSVALAPRPMRLADKKQALDARQQMYQNAVAELNAQLKDGRIEADEWLRRMMGEVKDLHTTSYAIGYSGRWDEIGRRDWLAVANTTRRQYRFLRSWRQEIMREGLDSFSLAQLNDRAQKYGAAASESFEKGYSAEVGMPPGILPAYPGDGTTICMTRCKCRWAINILDKQNQDFDCTWKLGVAEHCVAAGTVIHTVDGSATVRRACNEGTREIYTGNSLQQTNGVVMSGTKPCVKLKTEHGYEITCTEDHELRYFDPISEELRWVSAGQVKHPDLLVMRRGYNWDSDGGQSIDSDLAELMGYYDGNGHITEMSITYADGTPKRQVGFTIPRRYDDTLERYQSALESELGFQFNVNEHSGSDKVWLVRSSRREAGEWVVDEGLKNGDLPSRIRSADAESQAAYLRGLFDADGHVDQRGMIVTLSSADRSFIREIQDLLFALGIVSKWTKSTRGTNYKEDRVLYTLRLLGGPNLQRFIDRIGFGCTEKSKKLNDPERDYTTGDTYPLDWRGRSSFPMLRDNIDDAIADAEGQDIEQKYQKIKRWTDKELYFATVSEVEHVGEREVYDVTDSPTNAFLADGFVVHNCETCMERATEWVQLEIRNGVLVSDPEPISANR